MGNVASDASTYLIQTLFDLYTFILLLRIILQWSGVNYYNPLAQLTAKFTDKPLKPFRRILHTYRGIDFAAITLLVLIEMVKLMILLWVKLAFFPAISGIIILSFGMILNQAVSLFFYAIILIVVISWINPYSRSPIAEALHHITEPLLHPVRLILPQIGGLDLSPVLVLISLKLLTIIVVNPLIVIGSKLAT